MERSDRALLRSGFVAPAAAPPLCGVDFPGGDPDAFVAGPEFGRGPGEPHATRGELARLEAILAGFPTSEAQDARILAGGAPRPGGTCEGLRGRKLALQPAGTRHGVCPASLRAHRPVPHAVTILLFKREKGHAAALGAAWRPRARALVRPLSLHCVCPQARAARTGAPQMRASHMQALTLP